MNKDDDRFGWPNDFDQEDDPIILNWQYFKDLFFGMLAIFGFCASLVLIFVGIHLIKNLALFQ